MAMIKGIKVTILVKKQSGTDNFNRPIYSYVEEEVDNVLVAPASATEIVDTQDLIGKKAVYTLAIPKTDTHDWTDCMVRFFGQTWKSFGYPQEGIADNIPLDWNKKVMVERYG